MKHIQKTDSTFGLPQVFNCLLLIVLASTGLYSGIGVSAVSGDNSMPADIDLSVGEFAEHTVCVSSGTQELLTSGQQPATHESTYRDLPLLCKTDNTSRRAPEEYQACRVNRVWVVPGIQGDLVIPSTSLVSSHLGRQYTLVGAKPSGTS